MRKELRVGQYDVICKCNSLHWFEHDPHHLMDLVDAARVKYVKFDPNISYPTGEELKLVETSSAESTLRNPLARNNLNHKNAPRLVANRWVISLNISQFLFVIS